MIIGGYDLHLYCDTGNEEPDTVNRSTVPEIHGYIDGGTAQFNGHNEREAKAQARAVGWTFKPGGFVYCPRCSRRKG